MYIVLASLRESINQRIWFVRNTGAFYAHHLHCCRRSRILPLQVMLAHIVLSKSLQPNARVNRSSYSRTSRFLLRGCGYSYFVLSTPSVSAYALTIEGCLHGLATVHHEVSHITPIARCALCYDMKKEKSLMSFPCRTSLSNLMRDPNVSHVIRR